MKLKSDSKKSSRAILATLPGFKFLTEVETELYKVTWPTREQVTRLSIIVIVVSALIGVYLGFLDYLFTNMMAYLIELTN